MSKAAGGGGGGRTAAVHPWSPPSGAVQASPLWQPPAHVPSAAWAPRSPGQDTQHPGGADPAPPAAYAPPRGAGLSGEGRATDAASPVLQQPENAGGAALAAATAAPAPAPRARRPSIVLMQSLRQEERHAPEHHRPVASQQQVQPVPADQLLQLQGQIHGDAAAAPGAPQPSSSGSGQARRASVAFQTAAEREREAAAQPKLTRRTLTVATVRAACGRSPSDEGRDSDTVLACAQQDDCDREAETGGLTD